MVLFARESRMETHLDLNQFVEMPEATACRCCRAYGELFVHGFVIEIVNMASLDLAYLDSDLDSDPEVPSSTQLVI